MVVRHRKGGGAGGSNQPNDGGRLRAASEVAGATLSEQWETIGFEELEAGAKVVRGPLLIEISGGRGGVMGWAVGRAADDLNPWEHH